MVMVGKAVGALSLSWMAVVGIILDGDGQAAPVSADGADSFSLLQVASRKREVAALGGNFGCEGKGDAANKWVCGEWGDPHRFQSWRNGEKDDNPNQLGWHWLVKSKDGQMQVQVFLSRRTGFPPVISGMAGRFGDTTFKILRTGNTVSDFKLIINGELQPDANAHTRRFADGFFIKPRSQSVGSGLAKTGAAQAGGNVAVCMDSGDKRFSLRMDAYTWIGGAGGIPINMELMADDSDIDKSFPSFCTSETPNQAHLVSNDDIIVSPEENSEICRIEGLSDADCQDPPVLPPLPPVEQACADNGLAFADVQAACEGERTKGAGMFDGCVEDCCNIGKLDECTVGPEDFDAMVDEDKAGKDEASAVGDPHINPVNNHKFDIER